MIGPDRKVDLFEEVSVLAGLLQKAFVCTATLERRKGSRSRLKN